jgi:ABC-type transporter Mla MlaB component
MAAPARTALEIYGPITRSDLPGLCERVCSLLGGVEGGVIACEVRGVEPDAVVVEALVRLQLGARRHGCRIRLVHASEGLRDLVAFMGLTDVLVERG